jgi:hypothetical protein
MLAAHATDINREPLSRERETRCHASPETRAKTANCRLLPSADEVENPLFPGISLSFEAFDRTPENRGFPSPGSSDQTNVSVGPGSRAFAPLECHANAGDPARRCASAGSCVTSSVVTHLLEQLVELAEQLATRRCVERSEGLVNDEQSRFEHERARLMRCASPPGGIRARAAARPTAGWFATPARPPARRGGGS